MKDILNITLFGAAGRMGRTLIELIDKDEQLKLVGALEHSGSKFLNTTVSEICDTSSTVQITDDKQTALKQADVVIDFALGDGIGERIQACREVKVAMLIGTTGLDEQQQTFIQDAASDIPILWASNMSLGVNLVFSLAAQAAKALGFDFEINIEETHHIHKVDAPSGTALSIGDAVHQAVGDVEIKYDSYREGEVIGDHTISFESNDEVIEIHHHAKDRSLFANGGLALAKRLSQNDKGVYQVSDLI